jgi:cytochrome b561
MVSLLATTVDVSQEPIMIAAGERRQSTLFDGEYNENWAIVVRWVTALVVLVVGIFGLLRDSWAKPALESWFNVHALFGLLLCLSVVARFYWGLRRPALVSPIDLDAFTRHLSRMVYLLLYGLMGAKQLIGIATFLWHGGTFDFGWFQVNPRIAHHRTIFASVEDFQVYLAYGVLALIIIHVLAAVWRHRRRARCADAKDAATVEMPAEQRLVFTWPAAHAHAERPRSRHIRYRPPQ